MCSVPFVLPPPLCFAAAMDSDTVHYFVDEAGDPAQMIAFVSSAD
jgi:hypothetical protein